MTDLSFTDVTIEWQGAKLKSITSRTEGVRVALVGNWSPLVAYLCGDTELLSGQVQGGQQDARQMVIDGSLGVLPLKPALPEHGTVLDWIVTKQRLLGKSTRTSGQIAKNTLNQLGLRGLGLRRVGTLAPAELWATQVALAASSSPKAVVLPNPLWLPEARAFLLGLLDQLAGQGCCVILCLLNSEENGLSRWAQRKLVISNDGTLLSAPSVQPSTQTAFRVKATRNVERFISQLESQGATLESGPSNLGDVTEFTVSLGGDSSLLMKTAVETQTALLLLKPTD